MGRRAWLFCGSDRGGQRAAFMYSLIITVKLNVIDPETWLADVLARIADHPAGPSKSSRSPTADAIACLVKPATLNQIIADLGIPRVEPG